MEVDGHESRMIKQNFGNLFEITLSGKSMKFGGRDVEGRRHDVNNFFTSIFFFNSFEWVESWGKKCGYVLTFFKANPYILKAIENVINQLKGVSKLKCHM